MLNLDTHILLHALAGSLTRHEKSVLSRHRWGISAIVLWEIAKLHQKGRISIGLEHPRLVQALAGLQIWPLNRDVCMNIAALDFASDPADELIAATSLTYHVPLVTRDERIRASRKLKLA
ncbi:MAG: type II toxin-antitoxin system VapC family toxin [Bryobacteraceae bacterium]